MNFNQNNSARNMKQVYRCSGGHGEKKEALIHLIANHMKKSYLIWNRNQVTGCVESVVKTPETIVH
jgi:hypothetical protein